MPYFKLEYPLHYPIEFQSLSGDELFQAIDKFTVKNLFSVKNSIGKSLFSLYPKLESIPDYKAMISEMVKNIFDSVNNLKTTNVNLSAIEIKIVVIEENGKLTVKFKDNGTGFQNLPLSKSLDLGKYLQAKIRDSKSVSKSEQRSQGKVFILGGCHVGLTDLNNTISSVGGTVSVKNRKAGGASLEISIPSERKTEAQFVLDCENCHEIYKNKNIFWNKRTHEPEAMYCTSCNDLQFFNPFRKKQV